MAARMTDPKTHSLLEDAQGLAFGATMASFGIVILTQLGMITGQTAGLAVLISYATGLGFGRARRPRTRPRCR